MSNIITTQAAKLGERFGMEGDGRELVQVLKSTAFKGEVTDAQMAALMVVANQYGLNPFTRELFAFPDKQNGIVPVVGVDGWSRIINSHPQFDGIEFHHADEFVTMPGAKPSPEWIECHIHRKDRSRPVVVREYLDEVYRAPFKGKYGDVTGPWQTHTKRFLRHKAMIQCARLAFGYGGIYDQDEAERIVEAAPVKHMGHAEVVQPEQPKELPEWPTDRWAAGLAKWVDGIVNGGKSIEDVLTWLRSKATVSSAQEKQLRDEVAARAQPAAPIVNPDELAKAMQDAPDLDTLYDVASRMDAIEDLDQRQRVGKIFDARVAELEQA